MRNTRLLQLPYLARPALRSLGVAASQPGTALGLALSHAQQRLSGAGAPCSPYVGLGVLWNIFSCQGRLLFLVEAYSSAILLGR